MVLLGASSLVSWRKVGEEPVEGLSDAAGYTKRNYREDPVYKKNLQRLIERNQKFEEESKSR
jgi:hypothetical protein